MSSRGCQRVEHVTLPTKNVCAQQLNFGLLYAGCTFESIPNHISPKRWAGWNGRAREKGRKMTKTKQAPDSELPITCSKGHSTSICRRNSNHTDGVGQRMR